jgi:[citrate (pro-3S)-lyase] ligase
MVTQLLGNTDTNAARALIQAQDLAFEPDVDELVGIHEAGRLVAVGARHRDILKMIAIAPSEQGGAHLGAIVSDLANRAFAAGHETLFVFTSPRNVPSFEALNFELLAVRGPVALLESGHGLERWLEGHRGEVGSGPSGAVVVNCNPFTLGHRWLIEQGARRVERLHVFVVREDRSEFPFDVRLRLVREGTADLPNVHILDTARYAVSALTFPSYFLKRSDDAALAQMELDVTLFGRRIAPFFRIRKRFFGSEPSCATTRRYNEAMHRLLPAFGIEAIEVPRRTAEGEAISASVVRARLREGGAIDALVPSTTVAFLGSEEGRAVRTRLLEGRRSEA